MKSFVIRIDLESSKGIAEGLPKLLKLFKTHDIKVSFYLTMGGESTIFEILKNRGKMESSGQRKIKIWSFWEKVRMVLLPRDFAKKNKKLLCKILEEGHELGLHGYKHRAWTRNLENLDIELEVDKMVARYKKFFGRSPISFTSPGFNINEKVVEVLGKKKITHISDFDKFKTYGALENVPITLRGKDRMPFIEYWVGEGKTDEEIMEIFRNEIKGKDFVSFYLHGLFEGRFKINLLEEMIKELQKNKFKSQRVIDFP